MKKTSSSAPIVSAPPLAYLVGIGASAGGLEALQAFFQHMPADTGMAFVVIQHLSADYKSVMDELLQRQTKMPVTMVESETPLAANHVYLISSRSNLTVRDHTLMVSAKPPHQRLNLPIDLFFHSLGEAYQERAVGIVLSGTGTDGSRGVKTIKEHDGLVMVQQPEAARFDGMPNAIISQGIADFVLSAEELAEELARLAKRVPWLQSGQLAALVPEPGGLDNQIVHALLTEVRRALRIDFSLYREQTILRRLHKRMRVLHVDDLMAYKDYVQTHPDEPVRLGKEFLIGVTRFFRDAEAWELLEQQILPQIFVPRENDAPLRFWVASCSSGEEAYSLCMLVQEFLLTHHLQQEFKIFATDVDEDAITFASQGRYPESAISGLSSERLYRHFERDGDIYVVKKQLRDRIVFARHNLLSDPPFLKQDLVLCRNMLIYIQPEYQHRILASLHFALRVGGYLFLGKSETLGSLSPHFEPIDTHANLFKNGVQASHQGFAGDRMLWNSQDRLLMPPYIPPQAVLTQRSASEPSFYETALLETFVPTALFVDAQNEVLYVHGNNQPYLIFPQGRINYQLRSLLREQEYTLIQSGMQRVRDQQQPVEYRGVPLERGKDPLQVDLRISSCWHPQLEKELFLIRFSLSEADTEPVYAVQRADFAHEELHALRLEIKQKSLELHTLREKLESSNEELQASNQELLASNEELQSTNEELQSVNEELYTVNSEFEAKIRSLAELNDDLNNFLNSTQIGLIFLDTELQIRKFTPAVRQVLKLQEGDVGRSISHFAARFKQAADLFGLASEVLHSGQPQEREVSMVSSETDYILRILPYLTVDGLIEGVVLSLVDVTEIHQAHRQTKLLDEGYQQKLQDEARKLQGAMTELQHTNAYLDSFVYAAAHDLRKPVANLISLVERLSRKPAVQEEPLFELISQSVQNLDHTLAGLIQIIDMQKMSGEAAQDLQLEPLLRQVLATWPELEELGAELVLALEVTEVRYIEAFLHSILQNLLDNAIKYRALERPLQIAVSSRRHSPEEVLIEVRDNGQGIPAQIARDKLFRAFQRYHHQQEGKGIGLYLVKTLVEKNGGWVDMESVPGQGTLFKLGIREYVRND